MADARKPGARRQCDECDRKGRHLCAPRAERAVEVIEQILVHTKGRFARKPFLLSTWQRQEIIGPIFGTVLWDHDIGRWIRQYRVAWIEIARKNGKSELLAAIALILLVADDEEYSEVYGCAADKEQAAKVFDVAERMVQLSPLLSERLEIRRSPKRRIVDAKTASYYEVVPADAAGNLGHNPHGVIFDEVLTQPSSDLWEAMQSAMGTRDQPLMVAATTAGNDPESFAAVQHAEMLRIIEDPDRAPHIFAYICNVPGDADPFDESLWHLANPALGDFLHIRDLRNEAIEARNSPRKEAWFRQFRLNQWQQQATRWVRLDVWDQCVGTPLASPEAGWRMLEGSRCFGGLDLSSTLDLTALALWFPDERWALWRYWIPEARLALLDKHLSDQPTVWARDRWLTTTEGNVIDYESVYDGVTEAADRFKLIDVSYDRWTAEPVRQQLEKRGVDLYPVNQGYSGMSTPMKEFERLLTAGDFKHGGNPVSRWNADSIESRQNDEDRVKPVKPVRNRTGARIDGMVTIIMAIDGAMRRGDADADADLPAAGGF